jgi:simple sugar transport system permease protein
MLVYVAQLFLSYLVHGPWRDPAGHNFPQSRGFGDAQLMPALWEGVRTNWGFVLGIVLALASWFFTRKTYAGFRLQVAGLAPAAAAYAGYSEKRGIWIVLLASGATAGLAGICEVAGPIGQLQQQISPGYGFAAIIVAWVGRLHPIGIILASLLMSLLYLGGENGQISMGLPSAITGLFQGLLLFYLLAADLFINFKVRIVRAAPPPPAAPAMSYAAEGAPKA